MLLNVGFNIVYIIRCVGGSCKVSGIVYYVRGENSLGVIKG